VEGPVTEDDDAVRIAHHGVGAEFGELRDPREAVFINLVPEMDRARGARAERDHQWQQVDRKIRPRGRLDLREQVRRERLGDRERLMAAHDRRVALVGDGDAKFGEGPRDEVEVVRQGMLDAHLAAGDGAEGEKGDHFMIVRADRDRGAVEPIDPGDGQLAGAQTLDLGAHRDQCGAKVLHMRLAGGVDQRRLAGGDAPRPSRNFR
jgi:hypothetical protein